jgi:phosphoribosylaminoimidazole-succinocarboxamide synthase
MTAGNDMTTTSARLQIELPNYKLLGRGKVRDIYEVNEYLLIIATDRISAFDFILGTAIPQKGMILTQMSLFWFQMMQDLVPNHLVTADVRQFPAPLHEFKALLESRSMLVKRAQPFPIECVARGYLAGSGWKEYQSQQSVCGIKLPPGLKESSELPDPIFTPATKAVSGHDENISFESVSQLIGNDTATRLRDYTLKIYARARDYARTRGIIIADTKFEFGLHEGNILLIDEVMTPDSSRFWPASDYEPGRPQKSFDKQFVRDYLEEIHWNKQAPAPSLPDWVAEATKKKYLEAYELLTGRKLPE